MDRVYAEIAFTPGVRAAQARAGSADAYAGFLTAEGAGATRLGPDEAAFVAARDGFYQATVSSSGWPYVQFRGGPPGFLEVLDEHTLGYADYRGNRQYVSAGNIADDGRVALILMDYPNRQRLKVWGRARIVEAGEDPALVARLHVRGYRARPERAVLIAVAAFDWNCQQHIPRRFTIDELEPVLAPLREEIARLSAENEALRATSAGRGPVGGA